VQGPTCLEALAIVAHRAEERSLDIIAMACHCKVITDALRGLGVSRKRGDTVGEPYI
jgi:hypothetical protein